ncbi:MAG: hypothetical protein OES09_02105, partial [Gammaproteobacteria bacterium]|nr:hypothetical protein [Gammaproteobacteria bacterium]
AHPLNVRVAPYPNSGMHDLRVGPHKVVSITYMIRDPSGTIYDVRDIPLAYVHAVGGPLFPEIERALTDLQRVSVELTPEHAFGDPDPDLTFTDKLENLPSALRNLGAEFEAENERGERRTFRVTHIADGKLTVDANHPLAGKTLHFEVTVNTIRAARPDEIAAREADPMGGSS